MNWLGVVDCNSFFVSCERVFRPDLANVPTVVLSSNDGCIVARSKEVKALGIPMGVPYFKIKSELKAVQAAVFSSNFPLYRDLSRRVMAVLHEELGRIEQYSVDEAFFELSCEAGQVLAIMERVKYAVERRVGIPVSVGVGKTKTIAKYASEVGKQGDGKAHLYGETWQEATKRIPVHEIWGIGKQTSLKLKELGINTVSEYFAADKARIDKIFGIGGLRMHDELSERAVYGLGSRTEAQKSIMSTRSFKETTTERRVVEDALAYHVAHVAEDLREMGAKAGWLSVMALTSRHSDWLLRGGTRDTLLVTPTNDTRELLTEALALFRSFYEPGVPYKKAGVVVGSLVDVAYEQSSLFADGGKAEQSQKVMSAVDALNRKFGNETVTIGRLQGTQTWKTSKDFVSPCYTTNWQEIAEIKA